MTDQAPATTAGLAALAATAPEPARLGTRDAILAAARAEVAQTGRLSVNAVAARAGVSRQTIQYHFGGGRGLREALATEGLAEPASDRTTEERLIDAAIRVFGRPGGGLTSIEAIAAEAGLTKGAVYHHFGDRAELLKATARRISPANEILAALAESEDLPVRDALVRFATAYYAMMRSRSAMIGNLAANSVRDPQLAEIVMSEILGQAIPVVLAWFRRRVEAGDLRDIDPTLLMQAMFGPVFIVIVMGPAAIERVRQLGIHFAIDNVEAYIDFLLQGAAPYLTDNGSRR